MGSFKFEDCPLKHYIRTNAWLPACRRRKGLINPPGAKKSKARKLRYFTFCAAGAIDVLMLDVAGVLRPDGAGRFTSVCFFDKEREDVIETQKRIPGAVGIVGNFTRVVLLDELAHPVGADALAPPSDEPDRLVTRSGQRDAEMQRTFIRQFPFDVINLDLEEFFFKRNDPFPGAVLNSLRKILSWQQRSLPGSIGCLEGFSLMFTTQIGPKELNQEYANLLKNCISSNVARAPDLRAKLKAKTGYDTPETSLEENFESFFRLAVPKAILSVLVEQDWLVDPERGIKLFEIERAREGGTYKMLHAVMDVKRQQPPREQRGPGVVPLELCAAYQKVASDLFSNDVISVSEAIVSGAVSAPDLDKIRARGKKYMNLPETGGNRAAAQTAD